MSISTTAKALINTRWRAERIRAGNGSEEETRQFIASLTPQELEAEAERIYEKLRIKFAADWDRLRPEVREIAMDLGITGLG